MKDELISILLTKTSYEHPLLARELYDMLQIKNMSLDTFRRGIPAIKREFNHQQYEKVIKGFLSKDKVVVIESSKIDGFYAASTKEGRIRGYRHYVSTLRSEAEEAREKAKIIELVDNMRLQGELDFSKEEIK